MSKMVYLVFREVSDQYGTSEVAGVFTTRLVAEAAAASISDSRTYVQEWPLDALSDDALRRSRLLAYLEATRPPTLPEIVHSVLEPHRVTIERSEDPPSAKITCPDLTDDEAKLLAGRFPVGFLAIINGRSAWDILS